MIIDEEHLEQLPAGCAMVDGCFDPLHKGHTEYFRQASLLQVPVLCNLASDAYIRSHKGRSPLLAEDHRAAVIDAIRHISYVFVSRRGTCWSLKRLKPAYYVKGLDWRGRLPEEQVAACMQSGIEIVFVDCQLASSRGILNGFLKGMQGQTSV